MHCIRYRINLQDRRLRYRINLRYLVWQGSSSRCSVRATRRSCGTGTARTRAGGRAAHFGPGREALLRHRHAPRPVTEPLTSARVARRFCCTCTGTVAVARAEPLVSALVARRQSESRRTWTRASRLAARARPHHRVVGGQASCYRDCCESGLRTLEARGTNERAQLR